MTPLFKPPWSLPPANNLRDSPTSERKKIFSPQD